MSGLAVVGRAVVDACVVMSGVLVILASWHHGIAWLSVVGIVTAYSGGRQAWQR